jgi:hypothetical protein
VRADRCGQHRDTGRVSEPETASPFAGAKQLQGYHREAAAWVS